LSEAEDGKRTVKFFQLAPQSYVDAFSPPDLKKALKRKTLARACSTSTVLIAGPVPRPLRRAITLRNSSSPRVVASPLPKDYPKTPYKSGSAGRIQIKEAERLYRLIIQSDNEYTDRANPQSHAMVRLLVGDAEKPASAYTTFEDAQMAAIIQTASSSTCRRKPSRKKLKPSN